MFKKGVSVIVLTFLLSVVVACSNETVTVSLTLPDGTVETVETEKGGSITLPDLTTDDAPFLGWKTGEGPNDIHVTNYTPILSDMTLYAYFHEIDLKDRVQAWFDIIFLEHENLSLDIHQDWLSSSTTVKSTTHVDEVIEHGFAFYSVRENERNLFVFYEDDEWHEDDMTNEFEGLRTYIQMILHDVFTVPVDIDWFAEEEDKFVMKPQYFFIFDHPDIESFSVSIEDDSIMFDFEVSEGMVSFVFYDHETTEIGAYPEGFPYS